MHGNKVLVCVAAGQCPRRLALQASNNKRQQRRGRDLADERANDACKGAVAAGGVIVCAVAMSSVRSLAMSSVRSLRQRAGGATAVQSVLPRQTIINVFLQSTRVIERSTRAHVEN